MPWTGRGVFLSSLALAVAALTGCVTAPPPEPAAPTLPVPTPAQRAAAPLPKASTDRVIARDQHFVVYKPRSGDTLRSLARDYLGDADRYWEIADFNGVRAAEPEQTLVIPLQANNPLGVFGGGYCRVSTLWRL